MTRAVSGKLVLAPCEIQRYGVVTPMSDADSVPLTVAVTDFDGG